ncbi:hypothetical protein PLESTF_001365900 [Pleodorina starrii]|nr:hypothetical protein PLESTM_001539900 [Pleodorina starrii]GLC73349.1 hypothetical protein PLESTF_001365900 [Pleodorina starrii]
MRCSCLCGAATSLARASIHSLSRLRPRMEGRRRRLLQEQPPQRHQPPPPSAAAIPILNPHHHHQQQQQQEPLGNAIATTASATRDTAARRTPLFPLRMQRMQHDAAHADKGTLP